MNRKFWNQIPFKTPENKSECLFLKYQVLVSCILDLIGGCTILGFVIGAFEPALIYLIEVELYWEYIFAFIFAVGGILLQLFLAILLFYGTWNEKSRLCRIWLLTSTILVIVKVTTGTVHLSMGYYDIISYGLLIDSFCKLYQGFVVFLFAIKMDKSDVQKPGHAEDDFDYSYDYDRVRIRI